MLFGERKFNSKSINQTAKQKVLRDRGIQDPICFSEDESRLIAGKLTSKSRIEETNQNDVYYCEFDNGLAGVFKPAAGEYSGFFVQNMEGSKYKRERAAYLVSQALDIKMVPPTVIREIDKKIGSLQQWIRGSNLRAWRESYMARGKRPPDVSEQELTNDIFKYCIADHDATGTNCIVDENGKLYSNDNGNAFSRTSLSFSNIWLGKNVLPSIINAFRIFISSPPLINELKTHLSKLLDEEDVNSCVNRIVKIAQIIVKKGKIEKADLRELTLNPEVF